MKLRRPLLLKIPKSVSEDFNNITCEKAEVTPKKEFGGQLMRMVGVVICDVNAEI